MNKLIVLLFLSLISVQASASFTLPAAGDLVVVMKEPILDNGSTVPPVKPPTGSEGNGKPNPIK